MSIDPTFRLALGEYESKNYKKSLSLLEKLLKKSPQSGAAYALKALVTANSEGKYRSAPLSDDEKGNKDDIVKPNYAGFHPITEHTQAVCDALIKKALQYGANDPMTCHIAALYYRHAKDYENAASAYASSMANRNANPGIIRDLASTLSQLRNLKSLPKTRMSYLQAEPGYRANYSSAAMAYDLTGEPRSAVKICEQIEDIIADKLVEEDTYENSSLALYKGTLLAQYDLEGALEYVDKLLASDDKYKCNDSTGMHKLRAEVLFKLGKFAEAEGDIRKLLQINPDNMEYYHMLFNSLDIDSEPEKKLQVCQELAKQYPKSDLPKNFPLTFLEPESAQLKDCMYDYISSNLKRGVPAIFSCLKKLYSKQEIRPVIEQIITQLESEDDGSNPLTYTWIKYFFAQHYYQCGEYAKAMTKIEEGIAITPTLLELYMYKARILKHQGALVKAAEVMNYTRELDLQDRFINTKATKYYLRAGMIKDAIDTITIFTKNDEAKTGIRDLHTLQACWFVSELAESLRHVFKKEVELYLARGDVVEESTEETEDVLDPFHSKAQDAKYLHLLKIGSLFSLALQRCVSISYIFQEYNEDQFDFHHYAFRKGTVQAYKQMIKWADNLYTQPLMGKAFYGMMDIVSYVKSSPELVELIQTSLLELGYSAKSKQGKQLSKKLTGHFKRSKKDKREEIKWKETLSDYCRVDDTDIFGVDAAGSIIVDDDNAALQSMLDLVKAGVDRAENADFVHGAWLAEVSNSKWVAGLGLIRKMKLLDAARAEQMAQATAVFADKCEDAKMAALLKMGLMRI